MLPNNWKIKKVSEIASITTGGKDTQNKIENGKYPFYVRSQKIERIDSYSFDGTAVLTAGDGVGVGKVFHYVEGKFDFHQRVYKISDFKNEIHPKYFFYFFSQNFNKQVSKYTAKTSVDSVRMEMISEMEVPLPPISEQIIISDLLNVSELSIEKTTALIKSKESFRRGLMQNLLTGKVRFKNFKNEKWEYQKLGDTCFIRRGASPRPISDPKFFSESGRGWIRISDVTAEEGKYLNRTSQYLSLEGENNSVKVDKGDLIMSICATIGLPKIINIPACIHDGFVLIKPKEGSLDKDFLYHFINFITSRLAREGQPGTQKNLNTDIVSRIEVPAISYPEQSAIASVLTDIENEIQNLKLQLSKMKLQQKGLMQQLLTGKIRVK